MTTNECSVAEASQLSGYTRQRLYQLIEDNEIAVRRVKVYREELRIPLVIVEELAARKRAAGVLTTPGG